MTVACVSGPTSDSTGGISLRCGVVSEQWLMGRVCGITFSIASGAEILHFPFKIKPQQNFSSQEPEIYALYRSDGASRPYQSGYSSCMNLCELSEKENRGRGG